MTYQLSIIIPIFNEAETIVKLIRHVLDKASKQNVIEIIVVDGGSTDNSQGSIETFLSRQKNSEPHKISQSPSEEGVDTNYFEQDLKVQPAIHLINSEKGRAKQMNVGAKIAKGNILYFLHADSFPPKNFDCYIFDEIKKGNAAGCFRLEFDSNHWWLQLAGWLTQFRWRACRGGDQSQFITRQLFESIGGFDENYIIYEDNMLINELYARKQFVVINKKIKTSARRYRKHGVWKLQYHFWIIYAKKWFGADPEELLAYYKKYIC